MLATDHENGTLSLIEELEAFYDTSQPSGADTAQIMGRLPSRLWHWPCHWHS